MAWLLLAWRRENDENTAQTTASRSLGFECSSIIATVATQQQHDEFARTPFAGMALASNIGAGLRHPMLNASIGSVTGKLFGRGSK